jgi:hypothetical protein
MKYDISVTIKPLKLQLEIANETSCEEISAIIEEEVYRKLESHDPEIYLDKVGLRLAKDHKIPSC